jgi:predicted secreted protein
MQLMQIGMQYYMFAQKALASNIEQLSDYSQKQQKERQRLQQIFARKKAKRERMLELNEKLDEQAISLEVLINKMRPDIV